MKSKTHYPVFILLALVLACGLFSCVDEDEGGYLQNEGDTDGSGDSADSDVKEWDISNFESSNCPTEDAYPEEFLLYYDYWTQGQAAFEGMRDRHAMLLIEKDYSYELVYKEDRYGRVDPGSESIRYAGKMTEEQFNGILDAAVKYIPSTDHLCGHFGWDYTACYDGDGGTYYINTDDDICPLHPPMRLYELFKRRNRRLESATSSLVRNRHSNS